MDNMTAIDCGTIYKSTSPSGRVYIGQTTRPVEMRWNEYKDLNNSKGQPKLHRSFKKHGVENHIFEVIMTGITSKEMLNWYEIFYIAIYDSYKNGLNCTIGGEGNLIPEEDLKYGVRSGDKEYTEIYCKIYRVKDSIIRKHFGYSEKEWRALSADMKAQMRSMFDGLNTRPENHDEDFSDELFKKLHKKYKKNPQRAKAYHSDVIALYNWMKGKHPNLHEIAEGMNWSEQKCRAVIKIARDFKVIRKYAKNSEEYQLCKRNDLTAPKQTTLF